MASMILFRSLYTLPSNTNTQEKDLPIRKPYPKQQKKTSIRTRRRYCADQQNQTLPAVPNFILAGTQKGGTSALRNILVQHPSMVASQDFERHYFDKFLFRYLKKTYQSKQLKDEWICDVQRHYIQSTWHAEMLAKAKTGLVFYEKTPSYMVDPDVPALIHRICPYTKIIVVLRDPIERANSHYKMEREKLRVKGDFTSAVQKEIDQLRTTGLSRAPPLPETVDVKKFLETIGEAPFRLPEMDPATSDEKHKQFLTSNANTNFLQRGMYSVQLQRWLAYFPLGESLLVLKFEDLQSDPAKVYERILDFLEVPYVALVSEDFQKSYQTRGQYRRKGMVHLPMANETRLYLERFFRPYNDQLAALIGQKFY